MGMNLKDCVLDAVRAAREFDTVIESCKTPKSGYQPTTSITTSPPNVGSGVQSNKIISLPASVKTKCVYITPCGWCTKWDKKCDKKPYKRGLRVNINPIDDACGLKIEKL